MVAAGWCRDKPNKPFRCLDPQYRRELVRVYLTNVEGVCRRFCDEKRARLLWVTGEADKFRDFWLSLSSEQQRKLLVDKAESILKVSEGRIVQGHHLAMLMPWLPHSIRM